MQNVFALIAKDGAAVPSALSRQRAFWTIPYEIGKYFVQTCYVIKLTGVPTLCKIRALVSYRFSQSGNSYWVPLSTQHSAVFNNIQHSALAPLPLSQRHNLPSSFTHQAGIRSWHILMQLVGLDLWQPISLSVLAQLVAGYPYWKVTAQKKKTLISMTFADQKNTMQTTWTKQAETGNLFVCSSLSSFVHVICVFFSLCITSFVVTVHTFLVSHTSYVFLKLIHRFMQEAASLQVPLSRPWLHHAT